MPESIPAPLIIDTLKDTFREARAALAAEGVRSRHEHLGWILSVPDTHQKTVLAALDKERALRVLTCSTEDEANAIAAGLWMGGEPFALMIQHAGLYASVNTLRGVAMELEDCAFPLLHGMVQTDDPNKAFEGVNYALLVGNTSSGNLDVFAGAVLNTFAGGAGDALIKGVSSAGIPTASTMTVAGAGSQTVASSAPGSTAIARYSDAIATQSSVSAITAGLHAIGSRSTAKPSAVPTAKV